MPRYIQNEADRLKVLKSQNTFCAIVKMEFENTSCIDLTVKRIAYVTPPGATELRVDTRNGRSVSSRLARFDYSINQISPCTASREQGVPRRLEYFGRTWDSLSDLPQPQLQVVAEVVSDVITHRDTPCRKTEHARRREHERAFRARVEKISAASQCYPLLLHHLLLRVPCHTLRPRVSFLRESEVVITRAN